MNNSIEKTIQRIRRFSLTCTLNDNGKTRHFHNGHEFVEIGGIKWAVCNVGATKPTDSGLYFAWGETRGFTAEQVLNGERQFNWNNYKYGTRNNLIKYNDTDKRTVLEPLDDAVTFNMGIGWRMPTIEKFKALFDSTTRKLVIDYQCSGVNGWLFTDKKDNTKTLFFPTVGYCNLGSVDCVGFYGFYWSSSLNASNVSDVYNLVFDSGHCFMSYYNRYNGFTVRGVVD